MAEPASTPATRRKEPPRFRSVELVLKHHLGARMVRVTLSGSDLDGLVIDEPAASVRLLLPSPGSTDLVTPVWNGNEFLLSDGIRPVIRTFTPRRFDPAIPELDLDMVVHDGGIASAWATTAAIGSPAAISGPGRGYTVDTTASAYLLGGDETAIPAISQLLESIPHAIRIGVHIEAAAGFGQIALPDHPAATVTWHTADEQAPPGSALVAAIQAAEIDAGTLVWCAGEAASMHRIRTHLFRERSLPRSQATVRGYWKVRRDSGQGSSAD